MKGINAEKDKQQSRLSYNNVANYSQENKISFTQIQPLPIYFPQSQTTGLINNSHFQQRSVNLLVQPPLFRQPLVSYYIPQATQNANQSPAKTFSQEYLNQKYPSREQRKNINSLDINNQRVVGPLDLTDFTNLKEISIINNEITSLNLAGLNLLEELHCYDNKITKLDLTDCFQIKEVMC